MNYWGYESMFLINGKVVRSCRDNGFFYIFWDLSENLWRWNKFSISCVIYLDWKENLYISGLLKMKLSALEVTDA